MLDDLDRLAGNEALQRLLSHYAQVAGDDRERWQDRLMELEGTEPKDLVKLHGELIAFGCVDQNTGATPVVRAGVVSSCYRITAAGLRALRFAERSASVTEEEDEALPAEPVSTKGSLPVDTPLPEAA
jgi:hypothetical protein